MSKLDDIRRMREANYERTEKRDGAASPKHRTEPPAKGGSARSGEVPRKVVGNSRNPDKDQNPARVAKFDRSAYQREYMREWRAKRAEELKRLRELVSKE